MEHEVRARARISQIMNLPGRVTRRSSRERQKAAGGHSTRLFVCIAEHVRSDVRIIEQDRV